MKINLHGLYPTKSISRGLNKVLFNQTAHKLYGVAIQCQLRGDSEDMGW